MTYLPTPACRPFVTHRAPHWRNRLAMAGLLLCAWCQTALAQNQTWMPGSLTETIYQTDPHDEIRKLLRQGKNAQALLLVEKGVALNPRDPQMRFWQGYIYEQLGQPHMAKPIYLALTQEYPELPEPHNNLGVLLAAEGDYGQARLRFEQALRANPNYAVASENLGDVLLQLTRQSYEHALKLGQRSAAPKIDLLKPVTALSEKRP
jgi:Flp pilus assembly protein TadD